MLLQKHKASGSTCFSHLRRQQISTVCLRILISICLFLPMPALAEGALHDQGPCKPVKDIPDGKVDLSCSRLHTQNVETIERTCYKCEDSQIYQCYYSSDNASGQSGTAKLVMYNGTITLTFFRDLRAYNCTLKNGSSSGEEQKVEGAAYLNKTHIIIISILGVMLILLFIGYGKGRNKLKNWWKNRSSKSQPCPSQAIQPPYVPTPIPDPEDDDLHSVATDGNADIATTTVDTHDAVFDETSAGPTEDPYPSGTATEDTLLIADSESVNDYDSEAHDSAYCDSYDSVSLGAEACGADVTAFLAAKVKNELLSKHDSQKQVEMEVFAVNQQVYNAEYC